MILAPRRLVTGLVVLDLLLVGLYVVVCRLVDLPSDTFTQWFDLDSEHNVPTWVSSAQLLLIALLALWRASPRDPEEPPATRRFFLVLALGFAFLSLDETAQIHEGLTLILQKLEVRSPLPGGHGMWILVYPLVGAALLACVWRGFLTFLAEPRGRVAFFLGAGLFVGGGMVVEGAGYFLDETAAPGSLSLFLQVAVEEGLELLGETAMVAGMLARNEGSRLELGASS